MEKQHFGPDHPAVMAGKRRLLDQQIEGELTQEQMEEALPKPTGFRLLVAMPAAEETYDGTSIVKVREAQQREQITSVVALVLDMGPDAYKDEKRFPNGPYCKVGDYVLVGPYKGTRFIVGNKEFRILADDLVEGVVTDPRGVRRV